MDQEELSSTTTIMASAADDPPPSSSTAVNLTWDDFVSQFRDTTPREFGIRTLVVLLAWSCMSAMLFGMNFMLDSFSDSRAASYSTLLSTAVAFLANSSVLLILMFVLAHTTTKFASAKAAFNARDSLSGRHISQLFVLGAVDGLGGVTGTYAAPNTPIAVQFTILATGVIWTFVLARWLVPDRDRPCTPTVIFSVMLTVAGAAVTILPQWNSMEQLRGVWSSLGWIIVFVLASLFPLILNVLYSRYLVEHVDQNGRSVLTARLGGGGGSDDEDDEPRNDATDQRKAVCNSNSNNKDADTIGGAGVGNGRQQRASTSPVSLACAPLLSPLTGGGPSAHAAAPSLILSIDVGSSSDNDASIHKREVSSTSDDMIGAKQSSASATLSPVADAGANDLHLYNQRQKLVKDNNKSNWPYFMAKLSIALFGDAFFQLIVVLIMLPLDFMPWFGAASSSNQSAVWISESFSDIFEARTSSHTFLYFMLYVFGFLFSHIIGATLSYYSPQLTAFIYSVNTPMNLILLAVLPSWNVFSQIAPMWASVVSIVVTAIGAITYASWENVQRLKVTLLTSTKATVKIVSPRDDIE